MIGKRVFVLFQLLAICFASVAKAQSIEGLQVGDRIRVQISPGHSWRTGRYDGLAHDTLWIGQCSDCLAGLVPLARVNELDLSEGIPRSRAKQVIFSTLIGLTFGAIGGGIAGHGSRICPDPACLSAGPFAAVAFGAIGGVIGAAVGAVVPTPREHWRKILPP